jgi:predicted nucleotidyltransferase
MRASEFSVPEIGINVRSDGNIDYADLIVDGKKSLETRNTDSLRPYVGKRVSIVKTGKGKAYAIGVATVGEPIEADEEKFRKLEKEHLVPAGSKFDIQPGSTKFLYPMLNPKRYDRPREVGHGIVSRKVFVEATKPGRWTVDAILDVVPMATEIWFHGSRAIGKHKRTSDTDILVVVPDEYIGESYLKILRILQKLSSQYKGYDIQPTHANTNIHRIAQEEGKLLYKKQDINEDENSKLAWRIRFRRFKDLSPLMPERENKIYLMPTDHSALRTFGNLTGKDDEKITKMPTEAYLVSGDARVGDMSIINAIHRELQTTKDQDRIEKLKKLYLNTSMPYSQYRPGVFKYPEILAEPSQLTKLDKSVTYNKNTGEIDIKDKIK